MSNVTNDNKDKIPLKLINDCDVLIYRGIKEQVSKESNAISVSKEFLRKQRQSLKRRQAALQAAKQELVRDILKQKQGVIMLSFVDFYPTISAILDSNRSRHVYYFILPSLLYWT